MCTPASVLISVLVWMQGAAWAPAWSQADATPPDVADWRCDTLARALERWPQALEQLRQAWLDGLLRRLWQDDGLQAVQEQQEWHTLRQVLAAQLPADATLLPRLQQWCAQHPQAPLEQGWRAVWQQGDV